mmetsp:Transcript_47466/g.116289  ORF Transcript_47466/g.116289 Transcript_47466/m.116289 type:complete len:203 (-) Transcript_47466:73-681(-)
MPKPQRLRVPEPPLGSVARFQVLQTVWGVVLALAFEFVGAEAAVGGALHVDAPLAVALVAVVSQLVFLPGMHKLIEARRSLGVPQPLHHLAERELGLSADQRAIWLSRLRAYENVIEWLPPFVASAIATALLGAPGLTVVCCATYFVGRVMYQLGYGKGRDPNMRIPGLIVSDFFGLLVLRGHCIVALVRHFAAVAAGGAQP